MENYREHPELSLQTIYLVQPPSNNKETGHDICPDCGEQMVREARCWLCLHCGWNACP